MVDRVVGKSATLVCMILATLLVGCTPTTTSAPGAAPAAGPAQAVAKKLVTIAMVGEPRTLAYIVEGSEPGGTATNQPTLLVNTRLADVYRGAVFGPRLAEE